MLNIDNINLLTISSFMKFDNIPQKVHMSCSEILESYLEHTSRSIPSSGTHSLTIIHILKRYTLAVSILTLLR